jgi:hypothetical protein
MNLTPSSVNLRFLNPSAESSRSRSLFPFPFDGEDDVLGWELEQTAYFSSLVGDEKRTCSSSPGYPSTPCTLINMTSPDATLIVVVVWILRQKSLSNHSTDLLPIAFLIGWCLPRVKKACPFS